MKQITDLLAGAYNLKRALEVAATGEHDITVLMPNTNNGLKLRAFISSKFKGIGNLLIVDHNDFKYTDNATMLIEYISPPFNYIHDNQEESYDDINNRIELNRKARQNVSQDIVIDGVSETLLKSAYEKLGFYVWDIIDIIDIALTIAVMDRVNKIRPEHIAEAIQYKITPNNN